MTLQSLPVNLLSSTLADMPQGPQHKLQIAQVVNDDALPVKVEAGLLAEAKAIKARVERGEETMISHEDLKRLMLEKRTK